MKLVSEFGLCDELHVGRTLAREIGRTAGARVRCGRRVLYDLDRVYAHLEQNRESNENADQRVIKAGV